MQLNLLQCVWGVSACVILHVYCKVHYGGTQYFNVSMRNEYAWYFTRCNLNDLSRSPNQILFSSTAMHIPTHNLNLFEISACKHMPDTRYAHFRRNILSSSMVYYLNFPYKSAWVGCIQARGAAASSPMVVQNDPFGGGDPHAAPQQLIKCSVVSRSGHILCEYDATDSSGGYYGDDLCELCRQAIQKIPTSAAGRATHQYVYMGHTFNYTGHGDMLWGNNIVSRGVILQLHGTGTHAVRDFGMIWFNWTGNRILKSIT
jgi:hypothetical protein